MSQPFQITVDRPSYVQQQIVAQKSGTLFIKDKKGRPVTLTWLASSIIAPDCSSLIKPLADVAAAAYMPC